MNILARITRLERLAGESAGFDRCPACGRRIPFINAGDETGADACCKACGELLAVIPPGVKVYVGVSPDDWDVDLRTQAIEE